MEFGIEYSELFESIIPHDPFSISTSTPVLIRIKKSSLSESINIKYKYKYIFWRKTLPIHYFINQVTTNLKKKYIQYLGQSDQDIPKFEFSEDLPFDIFFNKFRFKKQISTVLYINGVSHVVIGSMWEFELEGAQNNELLKFAMNCGIGERNSLGFGFLNLSNLKIDL
jgi:CRISPR-associated endoribonuclease Cas6